MGVTFAIIGALVALVTFIGGAMVSPHSAPQQAVQELRFVEAILGVAVMALGGIRYRLTYPLLPQAKRIDDPRIARVRMAGCRVDGLDFEPNGIVMFRETNTGGPWTEDQKEQVSAVLAG
jgi:hypothetical protein